MPDFNKPWLKRVDDNTFRATFDDFYACVYTPDYEYNVPIMGINSKGAMTVCGTAAWDLVLET